MIGLLLFGCHIRGLDLSFIRFFFLVFAACFPCTDDGNLSVIISLILSLAGANFTLSISVLISIKFINPRAVRDRLLGREGVALPVPINYTTFYLTENLEYHES